MIRTRSAVRLRGLFTEEDGTFVKMDFGRSFKPQGTDEELMKYGNIIGDNILGRGLVAMPTPVPERRRSLEAIRQGEDIHV